MTLWPFMKYTSALNVYVDTQSKLNKHKTYIGCMFPGNLAVIPVQVVSSLSGDIVTIILDWITSLVINNRIKRYISDNEKVVFKYNIMLKNLAFSQPEIFQGRGGFVELGNIDKHFVKNTRNILEFFS